MGVLFRKKSGPQPQQQRQQQQQQQQQRLVFFLPISEGSERQHLHPTKIWGLDQLILEDTKEEVASNFSVFKHGVEKKSQGESHPRGFFKQASTSIICNLTLLQKNISQVDIIIAQTLGSVELCLWSCWQQKRDLLSSLKPKAF